MHEISTGQMRLKGKCIKKIYFFARFKCLVVVQENRRRLLAIDFVCPKRDVQFKQNDFRFHHRVSVRCAYLEF